MRGRPSSRSSRTMWSRKSDGIEDQAARGDGGRARASSPWPGSASGASQMRKSSAPAELVVMISRSPWCSTDVLMPVLARLDEARVAVGRVGVDEVDLARLMVVRIDEDELARLRRAPMRRRSRCPSPHRRARRRSPACRRRGGRPAAAGGARRGGRRTASRLSFAQTTPPRVSGISSARSRAGRADRGCGSCRAPSRVSSLA